MIKIGKIVNTHGIKGEVRIRSNSDFKNERFAIGSKINVKTRHEMLELEIISAYEHKTFDIVKFAGYDNINDVLKFKNCDIFAERLSNDVLAKGEYFNYQLENLTVINQEQEILGTVVKVIENPGSNLLRVKDKENKTFLVPFNQHFIIDVDLENHKLTIEEMEGLR